MEAPVLAQAVVNVLKEAGGWAGLAGLLLFLMVRWISKIKKARIKSPLGEVEIGDVAPEGDPYNAAACKALHAGIQNQLTGGDRRMTEQKQQIDRVEIKVDQTITGISEVKSLLLQGKNHNSQGVPS